MSRTLLKTDYISVIGEVSKGNCGCIGTSEGTEEMLTEDYYYIKLTFNILVNGKLKVWGTTYDLERSNGNIPINEGNKLLPLRPKDYNAWYDIIDFIKTIGYEIPEEANINNWIDQFEV